MRIISWNVNGIRATHNKWELQNLIAIYDPDMIFMQEIKATPDKLTDDLLSPIPYVAYYNPAQKPGYAGTGVWIHSRVTDVYDIEWQTSFPWDPTADEGRVAHITIKKKDVAFGHREEWSDPGQQKGIPSSDWIASWPRNDWNNWTQWIVNKNIDIENIIDIFGIYFPNGGKSEAAWEGKLVFYSEFGKYMDVLRSQWHEVLWWGDLNCAHHEIDLARPRENDGKIGFHPLERAWLDNRTQDGWNDIWREANPTTPDVYSWWDVITRSRARNVGWRIDAWWGSSTISQQSTVTYLVDHMGSDHCPIMLDIEL